MSVIFLDKPAADDSELSTLLRDARRVLGRMFELTHDPEQLNQMADRAGEISPLALATSLIWSRVEARSKA